MSQPDDGSIMGPGTGGVNTGRQHCYRYHTNNYTRYYEEHVEY